MNSVRSFNRTLAAALVAVSLLFTGAACKKDSTGPQQMSLNGQWSGSAPDGFGGTITVNATVADNSGVLSGSGTIVASGLNCAHSLSGTRTGSGFSFNVTCPGYDPINYQGSVSSNGRSLSGAFNGSGFQNFAFTMNKN